MLALPTAPLPKQSSPSQGKTNMEKGIFIKTPAALPRQPAAAARREEEQRGLQSWGSHDRRESLGVFLWVQRDRQGWGQAGLCGEGAAGVRVWICPRQGFLLLPQAAPDTSREAALEWGRGALCALRRSLSRMRPPGDILFHSPFMTTRCRG